MVFGCSIFVVVSFVLVVGSYLVCGLVVLRGIDFVRLKFRFPSVLVFIYVRCWFYSFMRGVGFSHSCLVVDSVSPLAFTVGFSHSVCATVAFHLLRGVAPCFSRSSRNLANKCAVRLVCFLCLNSGPRIPAATGGPSARRCSRISRREYPIRTPP